MSCLSNPHPMPLPPYPHAGMTLIGAWENLVLVVVFVLESKGLYFTVNYRIIADLSRRAHPSFSCPILREKLDAWYAWHSTYLKWWVFGKGMFTSLPQLSLPFSPSPPQEFYPHCLEQCVCVSLLQEYLVFWKYWWVNFCFTIHIFILLLFCANLWRYSKH